MLIRRCLVLAWFLVVVGFSLHAMGAPEGPKVRAAEGFVPITLTPVPVDCLLGDIIEPQLACGEEKTITQPEIRASDFGGRPCPTPQSKTFKGTCYCVTGCPTNLEVPCGETTTVPEVVKIPGDQGTACNLKTCTLTGPPCGPTPTPTIPLTVTSTPTVTPTPGLDACGRSFGTLFYGSSDCCDGVPSPRSADVVNNTPISGSREEQWLHYNWTPPASGEPTPASYALAEKICVKERLPASVDGEPTPTYLQILRQKVVAVDAVRGGSTDLNIAWQAYIGKTANGCWRCWWVRVGGCFVPDTEILMADGTTRRIDQLRAGDQIVRGSDLKPVRVGSLLESSEEEPIIEVSIGNRRVRVTQTHPFPSERGYVMARDLVAGTKLRESDGSFSEVSAVRELPIDPLQRVINLVIDDDSQEFDAHTVVADGIVTGDLFVQKALHREREAKERESSLVAGGN